MESIALVDEPQARRIQEALRPNDEITRCSSWGSLIHNVRLGIAIFVNPAAAESDAEVDGPVYERALLCLSRVPFVLYIAPTYLRAVMPFARVAAAILLRNCTDTPSEVRDVLKLCHCSTRELLLREVSKALNGNPTVMRLFRRHSDPHLGLVTPKASARGAAMPERTLYRTVTRAGLAPVATVLRILRAAEAYDLMRGPGFSVEHTARVLGYSCARQLSGHFRNITGVPSIAVRSLTQDEFVAAALDLLSRQDRLAK